MTDNETADKTEFDYVEFCGKTKRNPHSMIVDIVFPITPAKRFICMAVWRWVQFVGCDYIKFHYWGIEIIVQRLPRPWQNKVPQ